MSGSTDPGAASDAGESPASRGFVLGACALFVALAGAVLWDIADIPPPLFGPIGSDALPRAVALIVAVLSLVVALVAWRAPARPPRAERPAVRRTLLVLALTFVYALAIDWGEIDFGLLSTLYIALTIGLLARPRGIALLAALALGAALGFGCDALFTRVLFIDLP